MPHSPELERLAERCAADQHPRHFAALAEGLRKAGALDDAEIVAARGIEASPRFVPGLLVRARIQADRFEWDLARETLAQALLLDPDHPVVLDELRRLPVDSQPALDRPADAVADEIPDGVPLPGITDQLEMDPAETEQMVYADLSSPADDDGGEMMLTESLAMVYRGQGHLDRAVDVLDALVTRDPGNRELADRRNALRAERDATRPRPYLVNQSGGKSVHGWLASLASVKTTAVPAQSSFDAFFQSTVTPQPDSTDLAAFQSWLKELDR